jgi:hypothetical protein
MTLLFTAQSRVNGVTLAQFFSEYSVTQLLRKLVIRISNYSSLLGPSGNFDENSTKLTCLEIAGYGIKYSTVLWLIELQIRRGRMV